DDNGPMEPWSSRGQMIERSQAKRELEEHLLREKLIAVKHTAPKTELPTKRPTERVEVPCVPPREDAPALKHFTVDKVKVSLNGALGTVDVEMENVQVHEI